MAMSTTPAEMRFAAKWMACWPDSALAVDGGAGDFDGEVCLENDVAADVGGLLADLGDVAPHDVADHTAFDAGALNDLAQHVRSERDRVSTGEHAVPAAHGGAHRLDDHYVRGQGVPPVVD